jgi:NADPH:quinone reductase-like Zn-dependent oxidoreductase
MARAEQPLCRSAVITQTAAEPTVGCERKMMSKSSDLRSLEVRSKVTSQGELELWLDEFGVSEPSAGELVVRIDAAPVNPSDMILMFGPADLSTIRVERGSTRPAISASIPPSRLAALANRLDQALPVGNEGAGVVVRAGQGAEDIVGRTVAFRCALGTYAQYRTLPKSECMILPEGFDPKRAASALINPLTVLGMVETMRREGHRALVHTAAASNVGQMLNRLCLKDGVDLVNIVRSKVQADLVRSLGARHVVDSSSENFEDELTASLEQTDATLAFDAVGGGALASQILIAMEHAQSRKQITYSRYGSATHKQVYIYGVLDPGPTGIDRAAGTAWGVGGWLMTWFCQKIGLEATQLLRDRVCAELTTTFASSYTAELSLNDLLAPEMITSYTRRATGQKYLLTPNVI